jgi:hypothetical protein
MSKWKFALAAAASLPLLAACNTDILSTKPETNATLPKKAPPTEPAPQADADDTSGTPEP